MNRLKLSPAKRQWLYGVVTAAVPILITYGIVDENTATMWAALALAVLGTGTATLFTNTGKGTDAARTAAEVTADAAAETARESVEAAARTAASAVSDAVAEYVGRHRRRGDE